MPKRRVRSRSVRHVGAAVTGEAGSLGVIEAAGTPDSPNIMLKKTWDALLACFEHASEYGLLVKKDKLGLV